MADLGLPLAFGKQPLPARPDVPSPTSTSASASASTSASASAPRGGPAGRGPRGIVGGGKRGRGRGRGGAAVVAAGGGGGGDGVSDVSLGEGIPSFNSGVKVRGFRGLDSELPTLYFRISCPLSLSPCLYSLSRTSYPLRWASLVALPSASTDIRAATTQPYQPVATATAPPVQQQLQPQPSLPTPSARILRRRPRRTIESRRVRWARRRGQGAWRWPKEPRRCDLGSRPEGVLQAQFCGGSLGRADGEAREKISGEGIRR